MVTELDDEVGFEEPSQDAAATAANDRNALAISNDMARVQNALSEFDRVAAGIASIEARYPKDAIYEVGTTKGMKDAIEHRAAWRDPRITVEKARKMAKAPLLALGKSIDARASWITEKLLEGEKPIDLLIKAEEARREEEKQARINAEAGRILAIQEALAEIGQNVLIASGKTSADIQALINRMTSSEPDQMVFQEMIDQARAAWAAGISKLETALKAKLWDEAEQKRIDDERAAEAERRAAEEARLAQIAAEQAAQAEKLAAQQRALDEQAAKLAAAQKAIDDAKAEEAARLEREAKAKEQARIAAELQAEQERQRVEAQRQRDADAAAEAEARDLVRESMKVAEAVGLLEPAPVAAKAPSKEPPTLTLGAMRERLGFALTAEFLAELGFEATHVKAARLYSESDWPAICRAISARVLQAATVGELEHA